jgi:hypothetical protein
VHAPFDTLRIHVELLLRLGPVDAMLRAAVRRGIRIIMEGIRSGAYVELAREASASIPRVALAVALASGCERS